MPTSDWALTAGTLKSMLLPTPTMLYDLPPRSTPATVQAASIVVEAAKLNEAMLNRGYMPTPQLAPGETFTTSPLHREIPSLTATVPSAPEPRVQFRIAR